jgi:acyl-CoA dehydrogenase
MMTGSDTAKESAMDDLSFRQRWLTRPIFNKARQFLPALSTTEREALEAGDVWWDADLFTGTPDWNKLLDVAPAVLSEEEQAFLDGPCSEVCDLVDDWRINWEWHDLPAEVWQFLRHKRFFGMIIPKQYGGLGFSAYGHSTIIRRLSTHSISLAVTVMVPNSLGPGELLLHYGTEAQKDYWLPRLAEGVELPCFGLTSPEAGSDAASMEDIGVVCWGEFEGSQVLGIKLNWHKRYITLGPVATVLGLAFKLQDPDHLLGDIEDLGITVALIPTDTEGVSIGRRHLPCLQPFQNGPNWGCDVFAPLDWVIGGQSQVGKGWAMLMSALAAGRGISLPSLSTAGTLFTAWTTSAYALVREQFGIPIGKFEGVQVRLARLAGLSYKLEAARRLTCAGLDEGHKLAVISAILKVHATYDLRTAINDGMDVQAGKAVIDGPSNLLGNLYRAVPVAITVEGANILTRNLIIFGQGAIRCHPYLLTEMLALETADEDQGLRTFDEAFWRHAGHFIVNLGRAWFRNWTGGLLAAGPATSRVRIYYRQISRYSAAFALLADVALLTLGGALKRRELLSARLGDVLSELYLLSAVLKRYEDEGEPVADMLVVQYCFEASLLTVENRIAEVLHNLPNRPIAWLLKFLVQPLGVRRYEPSDQRVKDCAELLLMPSDTRVRLTDGVLDGNLSAPVTLLRNAYEQVVAVADINKKMHAAQLQDAKLALQQGIINADEANQLIAAAASVAAVVAVDDFAPEDLSMLAKVS